MHIELPFLGPALLEDRGFAGGQRVGGARRHAEGGECPVHQGKGRKTILVNHNLIIICTSIQILNEICDLVARIGSDS